MGTVPVQELEKYDWDDISQRLCKYAKARLGSRGTIQDADEIAQEALRRFLDPEYADWDRQKEPALLQHLGSVVNGILLDRVRKSRRHLKKENEVSHFLILTRYGETLSPEQRAVIKDYSQRFFALLFDRLSSKKDTVAEKIVELELEDVHEAAEQAARLNLPMAEIRNARRRLADHRAAVDTFLSIEVTHVDTKK